MRPKSGCCNATVETVGDFFKQDKCSQCGGDIGYGVLGHRLQRTESCGVFEDFQGQWWFCWTCVSTWEQVEDYLSRGWDFVCQIKCVVNTAGMRYDTQDIDMLPWGAHTKFMNDYRSKVMNPEVAETIEYGY